MIILGDDCMIIDKNNEIKIKENNKIIITEDGLFYSNFSDRFKADLATIEGSDFYSEYLVWLKENYGIKVGEPQLYTNGKMPEDSRVCGIYIVDFKRYLADKEIKGKIIIKDEGLDSEQVIIDEEHRAQNINDFRLK